MELREKGCRFPGCILVTTIQLFYRGTACNNTTQYNSRLVGGLNRDDDEGEEEIGSVVYLGPIFIFIFNYIFFL